MIKAGDKIGIICCSNGQKKTYMTKLKDLEDALLKMGICVYFSECIYECENVQGEAEKERAQALMKLYTDDEIKGIFVKGGVLGKGFILRDGMLLHTEFQSHFNIDFCPIFYWNGTYHYSFR